eukprot:UC4_evm5s1151
MSSFLKCPFGGIALSYTDTFVGFFTVAALWTWRRWRLFNHPPKNVSEAIGSRLPSTELHLGFPPAKICLSDFASGKRIIMLSLPGAFTPT